ncbi:MAG TPA: prolyl oligopeptidase family serine peptidase [Candidatus Eisenbacteria bacterium]|jgi:prolyl oligopeptidase
MHRRALIALLSFATFTAVADAASPPRPTAARRPVEDTYWGTPVRDDYRWLEDWKEPSVRAWSDSENAVTRAFLDGLPMRAAVLRRVDALTKNQSPAWTELQYEGGTYFAIKNQPPKQQPLLVRLGSLEDLGTEKVVLDPNRLDASGSTTIDVFDPSHDGTKVAVSLSKGGTESGTVYVYDARTGKRLPDVVPNVHGGTGGGNVAWNADGTGFWRTRYPAKGERPDEDLPFYMQVYYHRLGTPAESDVYVVGREFPKIAEVVLSTSDDGRWVLADVLNGDGGDHAMWLAEAAAAAKGAGAFRQISDFADRVVGARFGPAALYLLSRKDAPNGKVLKLPLGETDLARATVLVPEGDAGIEWFTPAQDRLYVEEIVGGPSRVRVFGAEGGPGETVPVPDQSTVGAIVAGPGSRVTIQMSRFTEPGRWVTYEPGQGGLAATALVTRSPARFDDIEVRSETAISKDGTRVPLTVLVPRTARLDGTAPTLLTGYGGYGISQRPGFSPTRRVWFDMGGIVAIAHTRGGGEFGDAWHVAGNLTRKQNVFDDFAACAQYLVEHEYASPGRLVCQGGSNGGLLMGAMITQHPELFRAVVSNVGIYDMLRVELSPNGLFNVTEFGTVKDSAQYAALRAYSPYHRVVDGTAYPSVLFTTGGNDPRVDPMNSRKMTARLQAATGSANPILLRTDARTGHGVGSPLSARNALAADIFSFFFSQLGMEYRQPKTIQPSLKGPPEVPRAR